MNLTSFPWRNLQDLYHPWIHGESHQIQITRKLGLSCGMATHTLLLVTWPEIVEILPGDVFGKCLVRIFGNVASEMIVTYSCFCFLLGADMHMSDKPKTRSLSVSAWIDAWIEVFLWESLTWTSAVTSPANCIFGFRIRMQSPFSNGYPGWWITIGSSNLVSAYPLVNVYT